MQQIDAMSDTARARAFAEVYRRHYAAVLAFAERRIADRETAREIVADVFRVAWSAFDPGAEPTRAWLLGVARNRLGDAYRSRDRERRLHDALQREASVGIAPTSDLDVDAALARIPAAAREVLVLTYWDGLSAADAGRLLGISAAAVWVRLHRARRAFAAVWEEER